MSANFEQISGPGGRIQTLTPGSGVQTFLFNPKSLKGMLPGGDYLYCDRFRARIYGNITRTANSSLYGPNWQQLAQIGRNVRVWSPFLGEVVNKTINSVPLLANHDAYFCNGFRNYTRERDPVFGSLTTDERFVEYEFPINFARNYLVRPGDSSPWLGLFEGGEIEIDLAPATALVPYGWTMVGTWSCELVADWTPDRQPLIHAPVQSRLYRVVTTGPEYILKGVGSTNGLDGTVKGCRMPVLSWLGAGASSTEDAHDSGFYNSFQQGGISFGQTSAPGMSNLTRLDVPWRDQRSIDAVSAWVSSFLNETAAIRSFSNTTEGNNTLKQNDMAQWPYTRDPDVTAVTQQLINNGLDFFPLVWPYAGQKLSDVQKVDGDLAFTADLVDPPEDSVLHLFRTDEVSAFTKSKAMDLMERMGLPHVERGGSYMYVPKYAGARAASESTQWGLPLKIVKAAAAKRAA